MGWERGRYYTRSVKVNGTVVREYIGGGILGEAASLIDLDAAELRKQEQELNRQQRQRLHDLDTPLDALDHLATLLVHAALVEAGFHRHKRGEWRKKRGCQQTPTGNISTGRSQDGGRTNEVPETH